MSQFNLYLERVQENRNYQYQEMNIFNINSPENQKRNFKNTSKTSQEKSNDDIQTLANLMASASMILLLPIMMLTSMGPGKAKYEGASYSDLYRKSEIIKTAIQNSTSMSEEQRKTALKNFEKDFNKLIRMKEEDIVEMVKEIDSKIGKTIVGGLQKNDIEDLVDATATAAKEPSFFKKIYNQFFNKN